MFKQVYRSVTIGSLIVTLVLTFQSGVLAQLELNVGTSTTQPLPHYLPNQPSVLLPPPPSLVRQLQRNTPPEETLDMPLSLMGQQILEAVCESQLDVKQALSLMPDLSQVHIQQTCPNRLTPTTSSGTI